MKPIIQIVVSVILFLLSFFIENKILYNIIIYLSYLIISYNIYIKYINGLKDKNIFNENLLMILATIGALAISSSDEALMVMILYQIGELIGDKSLSKGKNDIIKLMDMKEEIVHLKDEDIPIAEAKIGDIIYVKAGEKIPLDGKVLSGTSSIDNSSLTGESIPIIVKKDNNVLSGSINLDGMLQILVTTNYQNSTTFKILNIIKNASERKTKKEKFVSRFSNIYTRIILIISILITLIPFLLNLSVKKWFLRSLIFLVISCPCALVISIPLGYFLGIAKCSKKGIIIKGSNELELLTSIDVYAFDKTGTLTEGMFKVNKIIPLNKKIEEILGYAAYAEYYSNHPIAVSLRKEYKDTIDESLISYFKEIKGKGIKVHVDKKNVTIGNDKLFDEEHIVYPKIDFIGTVLYIALNNEYVGTIVISDLIKKESMDIDKKLKNINVNEIYILSGDNEECVKKVSKRLNINKWYSELLPNEKVAVINKLKEQHKVAFIGDGINDAPVLLEADLGISMGGIGSDAAIEASDIIIMNDDISKIIDAYYISLKTQKIVKFNIALALTIKFLFLILGFIGITTMSMAVFADVGVTLIAILNTLRIYK